MPLSFFLVRTRCTGPRRLALAALALWAGSVVAEPAYPAPDHPGRAFPPGGSTDVVARSVAPRLGERLGGSIVVDNRPGAGTAIGAAYVAKAPADGYTLFMGSGSTLTLNPVLRKNLPYDPVKSFEPGHDQPYRPGAAGQHGPAGAQRGRIQRRRQGRARQVCVCLVWCGHQLAFRGRNGLLCHGRAAHPRALQGQRAGHDRSDRRPGAVCRRHRDGRLAAAQERQDPRHRGGLAQARRRLA
jgi:hypothetical protein